MPKIQEATYSMNAETNETKSHSEEPALSYCSCPNCGKDMGKTYDEDEKDLPDCPICGTHVKFSQNKKHEEIKRMAWELIVGSGLFDPEEEEWLLISDKSAWHRAEEFYKFAKEQEGEE